ncbi:hypothetical protein ACR2XN_28125 [Klebsiella pneumoniae]
MFTRDHEVVSDVDRSKVMKKEMRLYRARILEVREDRKKDVAERIGKDWEIAKKLFEKEKVPVKNKDKDICFTLDHFKNIRRRYPNVQEYYSVLRLKFTGMSVNGLTYGWMILLNEAGLIGR